MKNVYYSFAVSSPIMGGEFAMPTLGDNINKVLKEKYRNTPSNMHGWLQCPATVDALKNTYEIKNTVPFDFQFKEDGTLELFTNKKIDKKSREQWIENVWFLRSIKDKFASLSYDLFLFCEEDLEVEQHQAWYSNGDFAENTFQNVGKMNISKWLRPIHPSFIVKNNNLINVKKDEPLYYLKFLTNEKINFVEFEMTEKLKKISMSTVTLKFLQPFSPLKTLYNRFVEGKYPKRVIKEIKNNLV